MKKEFLFAMLAIATMTSCRSTLMTSRVEPIGVCVETKTVADLEVSPTKIRYEYVPTKQTKRTGLNNIINVAIQEALAQNNNADVLVEMNYVIEGKSLGLYKKVEKITIIGYPAYYRNFRSALASAPAPVPAPVPAPAPVAIAAPVAAPVVLAQPNLEESIDVPSVTADEYYIAYLFKANRFNFAYKKEVDQNFDMAKINDLIQSNTVNKLRQNSERHSTALNKYRNK